MVKKSWNLNPSPTSPLLPFIQVDFLFEAGAYVMRLVRGAYSCVSLVAGVGLVAFRDPWGIRCEHVWEVWEGCGTVVWRDVHEGRPRCVGWCGGEGGPTSGMNKCGMPEGRWAFSLWFDSTSHWARLPLQFPRQVRRDRLRPSPVPPPPVTGPWS